MSADPLSERASARVGTLLRGKYRIDRVLGMGGMAVVYKATHRNQAEFAIKMLHAELSLNDDIRRRFLREGYAANSVKHAGVVRVVDDDVAEDGAAFLVMELLDGLVCDGLASACGGRLPVDVACAIAIELLDVLASAHDNGIVHRDIKPANLFLCRDGTVKVLDFGIARVRDGMTGGTHATATGVMLGTPAFMSPEQALGRVNEIDARSDLWSVAATVFGLTSGAMVHEADTAAQLFVKLATEPARSLSSVVPGVPPAIAAVIDRSLATDRNQRWPSATAMRDALVAARHATGSGAPPRSVIAALVAVHAAAPFAGPVGGPSPFPPTPSAPVGAPGPSRPSAATLAGATPGAGVAGATPSGETTPPVSQSHPATGRRPSPGSVRGALVALTLAVAAVAVFTAVSVRSHKPEAIESTTVAPPAVPAPVPSATAAVLSPVVTATATTANTREQTSPEGGVGQGTGAVAAPRHAPARDRPHAPAAPPPPPSVAKVEPSLPPAAKPPPAAAPDPLDGRR